MVLPEDRLHLELSATAIERYCHELARYQAKPEKRVAALDTLRTFIGAMATPGEQAKAEFSAINRILTDHFEQARAELLASQRVHLAAALNEQRLATIVSLYHALSRDAFWSLLDQTVSALALPAARQAAQWCSQWLVAVKERSAAHCPYPDTIDFRAAGIEVAEYAVMQDIHHYFTTTHHLR